MRKAFVNALVQLAKTDRRIVLLTGDLGYMALEPFADAYPDRFFNVGVAEQNMVGIATGLAEAGFIPYVYSIATFAALRPYEFIRNGPVLHNLPVRIVGMGGGIDYGHNGASHYGIDDVGVMRIQPNMTVIAPADSLQAHAAVMATSELPGPAYFRLGKDDNAIVPGLDGRFDIDDVQVLKEGRRLLVLTMGGIAVEAAVGVSCLEEAGIPVSFAVVPVLNPLPTEPVVALLKKCDRVITVEAHYVNGGLGSAVAEVIAENGLRCTLTRLGLDKIPDGKTGSSGYLYKKFQISSGDLVDRATALLLEPQLVDG